MNLRTGTTLVAKDEEQREMDRKALESIQKKNTVRSFIEKGDLAHTAKPLPEAQSNFFSKMKNSEVDLKGKLIARVSQGGASSVSQPTEAVPQEPKISIMPKGIRFSRQFQEKAMTFRCSRPLLRLKPLVPNRLWES